VAVGVDARLVESEEELAAVLALAAREPALDHRLSVDVVGSYR
jgi:hypothetical protein